MVILFFAKEGLLGQWSSDLQEGSRGFVFKLCTDDYFFNEWGMYSEVKNLSKFDILNDTLGSFSQDLSWILLFSLRQQSQEQWKDYAIFWHFWKIMSKAQHHLNRKFWQCFVIWDNSLLGGGWDLIPPPSTLCCITHWYDHTLLLWLLLVNVYSKSYFVKLNPLLQFNPAQSDVVLAIQNTTNLAPQHCYMTVL